MADDEYGYLQADLDPNTLTVPRLRSILVSHSIPYPSSAKKNDLVNLFNEQVAPQGRKLLKAQAQTKRSTRGIVDMPSSQESTTGDDDNDDDEDSPPPAVTPARRSTRRSARQASEDVIEPTPRTSRRGQVQAPEDFVEPTPRTSRRSVVPPSTSKRIPSIKHARVDEEDEQFDDRHIKKQAPTRSGYVQDQVHHVAGESPFSRDNPFQSGSSPPSASRSKSGDRRRTTLGTSMDRERRRSRDARRRTDGYKAVKQDPAFAVPSRSTFEVPTASFDSDMDDVQPGEEFTPEAHQEIVKAERTGETAVARRPKRTQKKSGVAKAAPWTVLLAMLGGVATVWRQEKVQVGYCGVGEPATSLAGTEIPEWASFVRPECEPCPQHAYCYQNLRTVCEPDFVLTPHPLSFGGLVPLAPSCEPDSDKVRKIKTVADFAVESELRTRNAQYECGEAATPDISEPELKTTVSAKRSKRMTDAEFEDLWGSAMGEIVGREEVESKVEEQDSIRYLRSTSLARVPLSCAVRRSLRLAIRQNLSRLVALVAISLTAVYGQHALTTRRSTSQQAKRLAGLALDKLATQASLNAEDPVGYPESWISMVALRDDVLREEFRTKERTRLWEVVKGLVEGNANVRTSVREGRTGDVSRAWEWIGAVQRIEGSARKVGRLAGSPADVKAEDGDDSALANISNKWEEQRPYY